MFFAVKNLKRALCLVLSVFLMLGCSFAETTVTIENLCYGRTIDQMFVDEIAYSVSFMGHDWSFDEIFAYEDENHFGGVIARGLGERNSKVKHLPRMMGGKTLSVYEFTVYKDDFSAAPGDDELHLVTVEFDIPYETTIYAGIGNRNTGVYTFEAPIVVNSHYTEDVYMPRTATGLPAVVDRLYLYSYNTPSGPHYMALSLFINYDNLAEFYPASDVAPISTPAPTPVITPAPTPVITPVPETEDRMPSPAYNVFFLYLDNGLTISEEMIVRVVEAGDADFNGLRLIMEDHGLEFPISGLGIIKHSLDMGLEVPEEIINSTVDLGEATMDEIRKLFESHGAEFPVQEKIVRTISYQAMELYLSAGILPPADIVAQAKAENNLDDEYLTDMFNAYGMKYTATVSTPTPTPTPAPTPTPTPVPTPTPTPVPTPTPTPVTTYEAKYSEAEYNYALLWATAFKGQAIDPELLLSVIDSGYASEEELRKMLEAYGYDFDAVLNPSAESGEDDEAARKSYISLAAFEDSVGYITDKASGEWCFSLPYIKKYANGNVRFALSLNGSDSAPDFTLSLSAGISDKANKTVLIPLKSVDVLVYDNIYTFAGFTEETPFSAADLFGESCVSFLCALDEAEEITVRMNVEGGFFIETIAGDEYADTIGKTVDYIIDAGIFAAFDKMSEANPALAASEIEIASVPDKNAPLSGDIITLDPFDGAWTLGIPHRARYSNGTVKAALTLHGQGKNISGVPVFTLGFVNAEENENLAEITEIIVLANGDYFRFASPERASSGYSVLLTGENGHAFVNAVSEADEVILQLKTEGGNVTETISGSELEDTLKASAKAIIDVYYAE